MPFFGNFEDAENIADVKLHYEAKMKELEAENLALKEKVSFSFENFSIFNFLMV